MPCALPRHLRLALAAMFVLAPPAAAQQILVPPPLDVPYVPTPTEIVRVMLDLAAPTPDDLLYDLGSGDGRIVITAALAHGTRGIGVDLDPQRVSESREKAAQAGVTRLVEFREGDLFDVELRDATIVTLYLLPSLNARLRPKLFDELRPGTRIASHAFDMGDWTPDTTVTLNHRTVYFWVMPARVDGHWKVSLPGDSGARTLDLRLTQRQQQVQGTVDERFRAGVLETVRLRGDSIAFTVADSSGGGAARLRFTGRVDGDRMTGSLRADRGGPARRWSAERMAGRRE